MEACEVEGQTKNRAKREETMFRTPVRLAFLTASLVALPLCAAMGDDTQITRGEYLVTIGGCNDCHTPGYFFGKPDMSRFLGGSDVGFEMPGLGVFVGPNITPDKETGIGNWTPEQIVAAMQTGVRPDGRTLAPIMPWHAFAHLTADDAMAISAFLQSLKPVNNQVPGPFKPEEKVSTFMFRIMPPGETAAAAPK
jgi:mono/diheme cytochrome c family protein